MYVTMILIALAIAAGRIAVVTSKQGDTAFLSANDRSRWCTVATLVERGTYAIDSQIEIADKIKRHHHPWGTIDKVRHLGSDGKQHYYSSKPPLFPTLVAGVYKAVNVCTGMTLTDQPIYVTRIVLALVNLPLLAIFYWCTLLSIQRICRNDWSVRIAAYSTCFATMLLPFSISLNNHLPAATATAVVMWIYIWTAERLDDDSRSSQPSGVSWVWWVLAGTAAAFAAANELPALSMMGLWLVLFAWISRTSIAPFLLGVAIVAAGFFGTNLIAHDSWRPPYAHRGNGPEIARLNCQQGLHSPALSNEIKESLVETGNLRRDQEIAIQPSDEAGRWVVSAGEKQFSLLKNSATLQDSPTEESPLWQLAQWDDWYEYPGTYWKEGVRTGVDLGEPSRMTYLLHMTLGHHGLFSITPIWCFMPLGLILNLLFAPSDLRRLAFAVGLASTVCVLFYLARPLIDRNYGGVSVCFRWMLWFAPLWLFTLIPAIDRFSDSSLRRCTVMAMLAFSVMSVSMSLVSPWQSPWLYQFWQFLGWIGP